MAKRIDVIRETKLHLQVIQFEQGEQDELFDADSYDMVVQFLNNCDDVYKTH